MNSNKNNKSVLSDILSKFVIFCSIFYKIPQIIKIYNSKSANGISLNTNIQDLINYIFALSYSYGKKHPFSAYGENFFQGLSSLIICSQIYYYFVFD